MSNPKWEVLKAGRSWSNESNGVEMAGCISEGGRVVAYLPSHFKDAPLLASAPELLAALEALLGRVIQDNELTGSEYGPSGREIVEQAEAVIRKAKGEA